MNYSRYFLMHLFCMGIRWKGYLTSKFYHTSRNIIFYILLICLVGIGLKCKSTDPDPLTVSISGYSNLSEPSTAGAIFLRLSENASATVTINLEYIDVTASGGIDYINSILSTQINSGEDVATLTIPLLDDSLVEGTESFIVRIRLVDQGVEISSSSSSVTLSITDNDTTPTPIVNHPLVEKWAPEVRLTSGEDAYPASVDWFLQLVELRYFVSDNSRILILPAGSITKDNLLNQSYNGELSGNIFGIKTNFFLNITNNQIRLGQPSINNTITAACYAHMKQSVHSSSIDIQYWFFYANNSMEWLGFGRHDGDWEHITVRVSSDGNNLLGVFYAKHLAEGQWEFNIETTPEGRPVVYSARGSHASYTTIGTHSRRHSWLINLPDDVTDGAGPIWKCWQNVVELGEIENPLNGQNWLKFSGKWGGSFATGNIAGEEQPSPHTPSFKDPWNDEGIGIAWNSANGIEYNQGDDPSVFVTDNGRVVEIHSGGGNNNLYYNIGSLNSNYTITWYTIGEQYENGDNPSLFITNDGTVVEIHNGGGNNNLYYNVGSLNSNYTITWYTIGEQYDHGDNPNIFVTNDGKVVEIHNGGGNNNLYYNVGSLNSNYTITWYTIGEQYDHGDNPSVFVINDGTVIEIHNGGGNNNLYYNIGHLNSNYTITWFNTGVQYDNGDNPSLFVTNDGTVVDIHNGGGNNNLYYNVGRLNSNHTIWWHTIGRISDKGDRPAIAITADNTVVDIHNGGGNDNLYYNVGRLIK